MKKKSNKTKNAKVSKEDRTCLTCGRQTCDRQPEDNDPVDCEAWRPNKKSGWKKSPFIIKNIKNFKFNKIELASQDKVDGLQCYIDKILKALGHSDDALVTDESCISDFLDIFDKKEGVKQIKKAEKKLGIKISSGDYIWEVAERIKNE